MAGRYDAVLLDAFGTLVALDRPATRLRDSLRARLGIEVDQERARSAIRAETAHYAAGCRWAADAASRDTLRRECAGVLERELDVNAGVERMLEVLADAIVLRPFADVPPALRLLDERGLALAVVSNGDCSLGESLETAGLRFDVVIDSATTGSAKPDFGKVAASVARIKRHTKLPVAVGFGVRTAKDARAIAESADAVVVGSALVNAVKNSLDRNGNATARTVKSVTKLVAELAKGVRGAGRKI